jgi:hypothetical protein
MVFAVTEWARSFGLMGAILGRPKTLFDEEFLP